MTDFPPDVAAALASLRTRWGAAAPRRFGEPVGGIGRIVGEVVGALATVPLPGEAGPEGLPGVGPAVHHDTFDGDRVVRTGFAKLDAILGTGGVPRSTALVLRGGRLQREDHARAPASGGMLIPLLQQATRCRVRQRPPAKLRPLDS
jgi:hypothetical protein